MDHKLVCAWLELPSENWPPDHYQLLGLQPGESDPKQIEEQVHQRVETLRRYQLTHPDIVTETMNRLVQAFVCLTDPEARRTYDASRGGLNTTGRSSTLSSASRPEKPASVSSARRVVQSTLRAPTQTWPPAAPLAPRPSLLPLSIPPVRPIAEVDIPVVVGIPILPVMEDILPADLLPPTPAVLNGSAVSDASTTDQDPAVVAPSLPAPAVEAEGEWTTSARSSGVVEAAHASPQARRGLGTKRALYHRIARTRQLLRAWEAAGKYFSNPRRRLVKPAEATELINQLNAIRKALQSFPPLLGEAGQPGYAVVVLTRQSTPVPIFQTLLLSQRQTLAQHWRTGHDLLLVHRRFLRQELRALRKKNLIAQSTRALWYVLTDQPGVLLLLLALMALNVAIWRDHIHANSSRLRDAFFVPPLHLTPKDGR